MRRHGHRRRGSLRTNASLLLGLAVLSLGACADLFGLDDVGVRAEAGRAGDGAARGGSAGRRGGASGGGGRAGGTAAGSGGEPGGEGGSPAGSGGISAGTGGGGSGGTTSSGGGGKEPAVTVPGTARLGDECAKENEAACSDASPFLLLTCRGGEWTANGTCNLDERCDPRDPSFCTPLDATCAHLMGPICDGNAVLDCSPEHYAAEHRVCPFGCRDGACDPGSATQLTIHTGVTSPTGNAWDADIPVCLATADAGAEWGWVRTEIERVYNRFLSVEFVGWAACGAEKSEVALSFEDDCRGDLVNELAPGKPDGDERLALTICRSYVDNAGDPHSVDENESLIRLLARHQFGHVLALIDGTDPHKTALVRGVEQGHEDELTLTARNYGELDSVFGKGVERIATPNGDCLTASSIDPGATVGVGPCVTGPGPQAWATATDRIRSSDSNSCFETSGTSGDGITLATCGLTGNEQLFRLAHAQWRTATRCVAPERIPPTEGTLLLTEPCTADVGDPSQAWSFEIRDGRDGLYDVQIHFGDSGLCVTTPSDADFLDPVALAPCVTSPLWGDPQVVRMNGGYGILGANGYYCLNWQELGGLLFLATCDWNSRYLASGALEGANGMALSQSKSGTLVTTLLGTPPSSDQIFDVYF